MYILFAEKISAKGHVSAYTIQAERSFTSLEKYFTSLPRGFYKMAIKSTG